MAQHVLENVRCTLTSPGNYGELRCDSSGIPVCPLPSSSYVSEESEISSEEISSEFVSSLEISSALAPSSEIEVSSLAASSLEEVSSAVAESSLVESSAEVPSGLPPQPSEISSFISSAEAESSAEISSEISALPCVTSGIECSAIGCDECCAVQIREIRQGSGYDPNFCPPGSPTKRDIILWFYTLEEIADFCRGNGEYCDFYVLPVTQCDEFLDNAILYFDVCCGCEGPSGAPSS